jgi:DNA polymerase (family 10)
LPGTIDNRQIARLLSETADLMEIDGADSFRVRSYRRAAETAEQTTVNLAAAEPAGLLAIPGIGKGMAAHIKAVAETGTMPQREELLAKYGTGILELLKLPGMGPKTVALLWDAAKVSSVDQLAEAIAAGRLNGLPRMGAKQIEKLAKGIEDYRRAAGRFRIDVAEQEGARLVAYLSGFDGIDRVTPAGSLRRGRETVGDLDLLATGPACDPGSTEAAVEHVAAYAGIRDIIAKGENKISFNTHEGLQVDVRLLPAASYGAALQYFTGSKAHNVALRQRALKMGFTLSEWSLARLDDESVVAAATEEEIYSALDLKWIPPEMRENLGEIELAARGELPELIRLEDIRGDLHMHTTASDGRNSIREMAEAAVERGLGYIAITDHTKALAMANGLDEKRAIEHVARIREVDREMKGRIRVFSGIEVDIMGDGSLDLDDEVLAQMDVVIASVHSRFDQPREEMTARIIAAIENPHVDILGHPTGRLLLKREPYELDMGAVLRRAVELGVAMEMNAAAERLDLCDRDLRLAKELGAKIVISTDAHSVAGVGRMEYGVSQLRRAWLTAADVLNTKEAGELIAGLRRRA